MISACGLVCDECRFFEKECSGCFKIKGQTFWAKEMMPDKTCPLFNCAVNTHEYNHCGNCAELPCNMFKEFKDPDSSEEEHQEYLIKRVELLKSQL
ncbi:MAG: DUF3795 domain-containing protein [Bacteroidota bacterium]